MDDKYSNINSRNQKNQQPAMHTPPVAKLTKYLPGTEPRQNKTTQDFIDTYNMNSDKNIKNESSFYQNDVRTISDVRNQVADAFASSGADIKNRFGARYAQLEMMINTFQASTSEIIATCHANVSKAKGPSDAEIAKRTALADKINDITATGYSEPEARSNAMTSMYNEMEAYAVNENMQRKDGKRDYITIVNGKDAYLMKLDKPISEEGYNEICPMSDAIRFNTYIEPYVVTIDQTGISVKLGEKCEVKGELCVDGRVSIDTDEDTLQREREYEASKSGPDIPPPGLAPALAPVKTLTPEIEEPENKPDKKPVGPDWLPDPDCPQPGIIYASGDTKPSVKQNLRTRFDMDLSMSYTDKSLEDDGPDL